MCCTIVEFHIRSVYRRMESYQSKNGKKTSSNIAPVRLKPHFGLIKLDRVYKRAHVSLHWLRAMLNWYKGIPFWWNFKSKLNFIPQSFSVYRSPTPFESAHICVFSFIAFVLFSPFRSKYVSFCCGCTRNTIHKYTYTIHSLRNHSLHQCTQVLFIIELHLGFA